MWLRVVCTRCELCSVSICFTQALNPRLSKAEVLVVGFKVDITREVIQCLNPGVWLNDEVGEGV